jgi:serine/threonine protein kinase
MIGRVFMGRYEAVRLLGEGGMGRVYLARQLDLGRQVVVKVMHDHIAADETFRARFKRETLLMAGFQHPYAVTLYDASIDDPSGPCIIMEYVKGINLDAMLGRNGRFSATRVGRILGQLCEVLQAAHDQGIIHRDLKPANLMVIDADTPRERIKVMDFGLAKPIESHEWRKVTDTNVDFAVGTPGYICPEQVRGEPIDHRGDLYSVGVILYELLTGRLPFPGPSSMDMMLAHATEPPPAFAELGLTGWVPPEVEELVLECLAKEPDQRPQQAREIAERYETALLRAHQQEEELLAAAAPGPAKKEAAPNQHPPLPGLGGHVDPNALIFQMEAWMPEKIATMKMRGLVNDLGGEVVESVPGLIRVQLGELSGRDSRVGRRTPGPFTWFGLGKRSHVIDMELRMIQNDPQRENRLQIVVLFTPASSAQAADPTWKARCTQIYCEVRDYLMGRSAEVS